jgi:hypothetical protein
VKPKLQNLRKTGGIVLIVAALAAVVLSADYYSRCYGKPFSRDEAMRRANAQLQYLAKYFVLGDTPPVLVDEQYDSYAKTWMLTFRSPTCEVIVIADRCRGTDIGGLSEGCKER